MTTRRILRFPRKLKTVVVSVLLLGLTLTHASCFLDAKVERYYGGVNVPHDQQFHWSDGGLPQTFDPAFAAAPPDTDLVRAIFEGLTDYDPRTLTPVPAVATRWEASNGGRVWTFYLRDDARWSNGEPVTAADFVRSWRRTLRIGDLAPHTELLSNIEGAKVENEANPRTATATTPTPAKSSPEESKFGVEAVSDRVLRVRLRRPDLNFPALVAHPVFRPVKVSDEAKLTRLDPHEVISNGAFSLATMESSRVLLERAANYWNKEQVALQQVAFVGEKDTESALNAYRNGEVDAVTNAAFEPLAIKLLTPYEDFRRTTYGALTYYTFNTAHAPFDDVRVREALALAIDRDRISADEMGGATQPAKRFLPEGVANEEGPVVSKSQVVETDDDQARALLAQAGFPDGKGFPVVRLLVNRNEPQRSVAQAVATMWHSVLNIDCEIIVKNWDEYEASIRAGDYDVVRRGVVMQTTDELTNIRMIFGDNAQAGQSVATKSKESSVVNAKPRDMRSAQQIETEDQALRDLSAFPIYFASSYSLVKPYVTGFDSNVLDAPSLKNVRIDNNWSATATLTSHR